MRSVVQLPRFYDFFTEEVHSLLFSALNGTFSLAYKFRLSVSLPVSLLCLSSSLYALMTIPSDRSQRVVKTYPKCLSPYLFPLSLNVPMCSPCVCVCLCACLYVAKYVPITHQQSIKICSVYYAFSCICAIVGDMPAINMYAICIAYIITQVYIQTWIHYIIRVHVCAWRKSEA